MRVLVTGGAGFIGSNFVHRTLLTRPEVEITVADSFTYAANPASLQDANGQWICAVERVDVRDAQQIAPLIARHDVVVHFAAESHNDNSLRHADPFVTTNVLGTVEVAKACVAHGVRLHHISTDEVFGDLALDDPQRFTRETPYRPSSPYSASKAAADHFVRAWVRSYGLEATISNCSNNYGPRQHPEKFIPRQICGLLEGKRPRLYGSGENVRDWIHVDDHNDAVWAILDRGEVGQTYLIGADGERSNLDVVKQLLRAFELPADGFVHVTDRPGHDMRYAIDPSSIQELGWQPKYEFDAGLAQTVQWYSDNRTWWADAYALAEAKYATVEHEIA